MRRERVLTAICLLLMATAAVGQNLVVNGDFNVGIEGWTALDPPSGPVMIEHEPAIDAVGLEASGSMNVSYSLTGNEPIVHLLTSDCIPTTSDVILGFASRGLSSEGLESIQICYWPNSDCSGGFSCSGDVIFETPDEWIFRALEFSSQGGQSMSVVALANLDTLVGTATGDGLLDKIFLVEGGFSDYPPMEADAVLDGVAGLSASFGASASGGYVPFDSVFLWDFGDGATSPEQNPIHTYDQPGTYQVMLTATNGFQQAFDEIEVTVLGSTTEIPTVSSVGLTVLAAILGLGGIILLRSRGLFPGS